jgi:outer membrane protein
MKKRMTLVLVTALCAMPPVVNSATGLLALFEQAKQHDAKLAQAQAQLAADSEILTQAKAVLLPNVSAQLSYQQNDYSKDVMFQAKESQQERLQLTQSLYDASAWARYDQAQGLYELALLQFQLSEQDLLLRLAQAYFDVLRSRQLLSLVQAQVNATEMQRDKVAEGVRVGLTNPVDLLEVQARYDMALSDQLQADNQLMIAQENLAKLIGQAAPSQLKSLALNTRLSVLTDKPADLVERFYAQNMSVRLAEVQLGVAEKEVEAQRAGHYPTVLLQASLAHQDGKLSSSSFPSSYPYQSNSIGVSVQVPLYAGGMVDSQVRKAEQKRLAAQQAVRAAKEQSRVDILTLAKTVVSNTSRLSALQQAVKSNEAFLAAAEEGNRVGMRDLVDVLNARTLLLKAQQDLANGLFDDVLTRLKLKQAQGELSVQDLAQVEAFLQ